MRESFHPKMPTPSLPALVSTPETRPISTLSSTDSGPQRVQPSRVSIEGAVIADRVYRTAILVFALCVPVLLLLILIEVGAAGWPALRQFGLSFLTSSAWDPVAGEFGAAPAIYGTIVTSLIALVIATPLALGVAIFLSEFCAALAAAAVSFFVDLLAAIPSVVYGLWGIFVLLPLMREQLMPFLRDTLHLGATPFFTGPAYGPSMLAAGLILVDHGPALHLGRLARSADGRPPLAARGCARARRDAVGDDHAAPSSPTPGRASSAASSSGSAARSARRWP